MFKKFEFSSNNYVGSFSMYWKTVQPRISRAILTITAGSGTFIKVRFTVKIKKRFLQCAGQENKQATPTRRRMNLTLMSH